MQTCGPCVFRSHLAQSILVQVRFPVEEGGACCKSDPATFLFGSRPSPAASCSVDRPLCWARSSGACEQVPMARRDGAQQGRRGRAERGTEAAGLPATPDPQAFAPAQRSRSPDRGAEGGRPPAEPDEEVPTVEQLGAFRQQSGVRVSSSGCQRRRSAKSGHRSRMPTGR